MILTKAGWYFLLLIIAISFACNPSVDSSQEKEVSQSQNKPSSVNKEIKRDSFYNELRGSQPLYLDTFYTDTLEFSGESEMLDYYTLNFKMDASIFHFMYANDYVYQENYLLPGDMVAITWKIDSIYIAAEDEKLAYDTWLVQTERLSGVPISDTLTILTKKLAWKFPKYHMLDWATGDLNEDGIEDFVVVLESNLPDLEAQIGENNFKRKAVILKTIDFPILDIAATNDAIVDCSMCSGSGDRNPYRDVWIENNSCSFESQYGGNFKETFTITFKYELAQEAENPQKNWFLEKIKVWSYDGRTDKEGGREVTRKEFGEITFSEYTDIKDNSEF